MKANSSIDQTVGQVSSRFAKRKIKSKHHTQTQQKTIAIAMIQRTLAIVKIMFPLQSHMSDIIKIPIKRWPREKSLSSIFFVKKVSLPQHLTISFKRIKFITQIQRKTSFRWFFIIESPMANRTQTRSSGLIVQEPLRPSRLKYFFNGKANVASPKPLS